MKVRDVELSFNMFNARDLERYETALEEFHGQCRGREEGERASETIRRQCAAVGAFFDAVVGEESRKALVKDPDDLLECMDTFAEFVDAANAQKSVMEERVSRYSPNRAARRAAGKK